MWQYYDYCELYHHGIQGQKWGVSNGPPYPLNPSDYSAAEKRAGSTASTNGLVKSAVSSVKSVRESKNELSKLYEPESWEETLQNCNPSGDMMNCTLCSVTSDLRQKGYDVEAGTSHRNSNNFPLTLSRVYPGLSEDGAMFYGNVQEFTKSYESACQFLKDSYGDNASGVCGIMWKDYNCGHAFSWVIQDGNVQFYDCQSGAKGNSVAKYWDNVKVDGETTVARLDNQVADEKAIKKYVM